MLLTRVKQFFYNPALFFACGVGLFYGHEGGAKLAVAALFLLFILICQAVRAAGVPATSRYRALITRPSTQQALVGVLCFLIGALTLTEKPLNTLSQRDWMFFAVALFAMISNICTARNIERNFARASSITLLGVLLVPQIWGLISSSFSMFYNGGYTFYVSLPLVLCSAWLGVFGRFGPYLVNAGMPFYLSVVHNSWYGLCNYMGDNPNEFIIMSCVGSILGNLMLGRMANNLSATQHITPAEMIYVEIPGLAYRAPQYARFEDEFWQPVSFRP